MNALRVTAALFVGMLVVVPAAFAGENGVFGAEPYPASREGVVRRSFDMPAGNAFNDSVRVYNRTPHTVRLALYAASASVGDDDVVAVGFREAHVGGFASRITLERSSVRLAPGADAVVRFGVRMQGAPRGSLAAIVVEGAPEAGSADLDLVQRIAVLVRPSDDGIGNGAVTASADADNGALTRACLVLAGLIGGGLLVEVRRRRRDDGDAAGLIDAPVSDAVVSDAAVR